jgi:integrase
LISKGFGLKDVQEWLGHADISMTANIYSHLDLKRKQSIAQAMANTVLC